MEPAPDAPEPASDGQVRRPAVNKLAVVAGLVVASLIAASVVLPSDENSSWPTDCLIDGRTDMCAMPSAAMTDQTMRTVVRDYCNNLSSTPLSEVVPQPFSVLDLAGEEVYATTTGSEKEGTEDALLGTPDAVAWVTRSVGGSRDGGVDLRCPGDRLSASVRLPRDQFDSTVAATLQPDTAHINFAQVAKQSVTALAKGRRDDASFGFTTCYTARIDLDDLGAGGTFACITEIYGALGQSGSATFYRVSERPPYVRAIRTGA